MILHVEGPGKVGGVRGDQHDLTVGGEKGGRCKLLLLARPHAHGPRGHKAGKVCDGVVGHITGSAAAVECDGTLAAGASSIVGMGPIVGVGGEIPEKYVAAPIARGVDEDSADIGGDGKRVRRRGR